MTTEGSTEITKQGHKLRCVVCAHDRFWSRTTLLNTRLATLLGFDWANKEAMNYVCENCGYIFWFFQDEESEDKEILV
jgi:predicted nucleic-acid-binding Zn-ribbon protein